MIDLETVVHCIDGTMDKDILDFLDDVKIHYRHCAVQINNIIAKITYEEKCERVDLKKRKIPSTITRVLPHVIGHFKNWIDAYITDQSM